ncbi:MAG: VOC family protein [Bacteroidetes bacterium]|nr:VOC family protein [Bacteroidota bacterium]
MLLSAKTVIRTKNFEASKTFYTELLELKVFEKYDDGDGSKGIICQVGFENSTAFIEISEISTEHDYFQEAFENSITHDKIDIQIKTTDIQYWADRCKDRWPTRGPVLRPWGSYYLYLRDPDGLQIILYQET